MTGKNTCTNMDLLNRSVPWLMHVFPPKELQVSLNCHLRTQTNSCLVVGDFDFAQIICELGIAGQPVRIPQQLILLDPGCPFPNVPLIQFISAGHVGQDFPGDGILTFDVFLDLVG